MSRSVDIKQNDLFTLASSTSNSSSALPTNHAQANVLANLQSLLPAQLSALTVFESKINQKIISSATTSSSNDDSSEATLQDIEIEAIFATQKKPSADAMHDPFLDPKTVKLAKKLTSSQRKKAHLHQFPRTGLKFNSFIPANQLFRANFIELCGSVGTTNSSLIQQRLLRADLHGAFVLVVKSTNPMLVNKAGFIIKETQKTFVIITNQDKVITVPKQGTIFHFDIQFMYSPALFGKVVKSDEHGAALTNYSRNLPNMDTDHQIETCVVVYGNQFCIRPYERPTRKFKVTTTIEMD